MKKMWLSEEKCTGCASCYNACPVRAINMETNIYGFDIPVINEKCIDCNLCEKTCEKRNSFIKKNITIPRAYATWSKNENTRFSSTSGGTFSELAKYILAKNGYVVGAAYDENNMVSHKMISTVDELPLIVQSKYTESTIGNVFIDIKNKLNQNEYVLFCGTPCQGAGLKAFLRKEYDKLVVVDFICRGVNSKKVYRAWLDEIEFNRKMKVKRVWFKYKSNGWAKSPFCTRLDFEDETFEILEGNNNLYMSGYLGPNLYIRPSCSNCDFKGTKRVSDITLADFWGLDSSLNDDKGVSLVLISSEKGQNILNAISNNINLFERDFDEILSGNVCFKKSVSINKDSARFIRSLERKPFSKTIRKYTFKFKVKTKISRLIERIKN